MSANADLENMTLKDVLLKVDCSLIAKINKLAENLPTRGHDYNVETLARTNRVKLISILIHTIS